jgi:ferredoxin
MMTNSCQVDVDRCTGCGACVEACPNGALTLHGGTAWVDSQLCRGCGVCIEECPTGAISIVTPAPGLLPAVARLPVPLRDEYPAEPAVRLTGVAPRPPSVLSRLSAALVPSALGLVAALGEAWLDRVVECGAATASTSTSTQIGAQKRRRARRRGRSLEG